MKCIICKGLDEKSPVRTSITIDNKLVELGCCQMHWEKLMQSFSLGQVEQILAMIATAPDPIDTGCVYDTRGQCINPNCADRHMTE